MAKKITRHFIERILERIGISPYQAGIDARLGINKGTVLYSSYRKSYKIIGDKGVYILSSEGRFITSFSARNCSFEQLENPERIRANKKLIRRIKRAFKI